MIRFGKILPRNGRRQGAHGAYFKGDIAFIRTPDESRTQQLALVADRGYSYNIDDYEVVPFESDEERRYAIRKINSYIKNNVMLGVQDTSRDIFKAYLITLKIGE